MPVPDLNAVLLDVGPANFRIIQQHTAPECTPNPITFSLCKSIGLQYVESPAEKRIILGDLGFDELEPGLHLRGGQDIRAFKIEALPGVLAAPKDPVQLAPLLEVFRADVAGCGYPVSGRAFQLKVAAHLIKSIRPGAVLVGLFQIEQFS